MMLARRTLITGAPLALALAGCTTLSSRHDPRTLRIVTFNIWHNQGNWPGRRALLIQALAAADPDIIALQEVLEDAATGLENQAISLARALSTPEHSYSVHFESTDPVGAPRRYGNAILSRLPVLDHQGRKLLPLNDYRTALRIRVSLGGQKVDIVNTHLASQAEAGEVRTLQVNDLLSWIPGDATPLVILGDFNATLEERSLERLGAPEFFSALPLNAATTTLNPAMGHQPRVIDHIFAQSAAFTPLDISILGDRPVNGEYPSDHFGVKSVLSLR